jgi:signal transduction histidine kinase
MYDTVLGQKKFSQLINACISHEMRNPINSLHSQNMNMKTILTNLQRVLDAKNICTYKRLYKEISVVKNEIQESVKVQHSSTQILKYLVSDILDFA